MNISKENMYGFVADFLAEKVRNLEKLISETRASNNDTKSSMGDKYETGREMLQQEINNLQLQLKVLKEQQQSFKNIRIVVSETAEKGALVETEKGLFYISVSLGEIRFEGNRIFCISPEAPLAKAMAGKRKSESLIVNNIPQKIKKIW